MSSFPTPYIKRMRVLARALAPILVTLVLSSPLVFGATVVAGEPRRVEVFTAAGFSVRGTDDGRLQGASVTVYAVDGLAAFESVLSDDLPPEADAAQAEALRRIGALKNDTMAPAKDAALGLARAVQYGVDRYPAIVFNATAVVYGITDLVEAVQRYDMWREAQAR